MTWSIAQVARMSGVTSRTLRHYDHVRRFWTPAAAAFRNLGQTYVEDDQWRTVYDKIAVGLAEYQRDAMAAFADARLS